jgi:hypothetical protein
MTAITTKKFNHLSAKVFKDNVRDENLYMFVGVDKSYASNNTPRDTLFEEDRNLANVVSAKRINGGDAALVVPRKTWTINTAYDKWSNNLTTLASTDFYVYNNTNHGVYLCVNNNGGADSTLTPNTLGTSIQTTDDSYEWKYLYSIDTTSRSRFLDGNYMPAFINSVVAAASGSSEYGEDPPRDLQAHHVTLNCQMKGTEGGDFYTEGANANVYMLGVVSGPVDSSTNTVALAQTYKGSELDLTKGDILYINYLPTSFVRSIYQTDNIKVTFEM